MDFNLNEYHRNISDELLLEDVKDISKKIGRNTLTQNEYKKAGGKFGKNTFLRRFGSWNNVLALCELKVNQRQLDAAKGSHMYQHIETEELLMDLKSVAIYLNKDSLSSKEYGKNGKYSAATYFKRFGTWNKELCDAGLKPFSRVSSQRLKDEELLKEIECVWIKLGRQPTSTDIKNGISKYSLHAYAEHFGGWRGALDAFIKFVNESSDCVIKKKRHQKRKFNIWMTLFLIADINIRHLVMLICAFDSKSCNGIILNAVFVGHHQQLIQVLNYILIILFHGQKGEKQYLRIYRHYVANAILGKVI